MGKILYGIFLCNLWFATTLESYVFVAAVYSWLHETVVSLNSTQEKNYSSSNGRGPFFSYEFRQPNEKMF